MSILKLKNEIFFILLPDINNSLFVAVDTNQVVFKFRNAEPTTTTFKLQPNLAVSI